MVRGLSSEEFCFVCNCNVGEADLYCADLDLKTAWRPRADEVEWPILLLLGCYHPKHVFEIAPVRRSSVSTALARWENSFRWRRAFDEGRCHSTCNPWRYLKTARHGRKLCPIPLSYREEEFVHGVRYSVMAAFKRGLQGGTRRTPLCIRYALEKLEKGSMGALMTDKDGGFCIVDKNQLWNTMRKTLEGECYSKFSPHSLFGEDLRIEYTQVCREVSEITGDKNLLMALLGDMWQKPGNEFSDMQATIKTHKCSGKVGIRALHSTPASPFRPAMRWISTTLGSRLKTMKHILKDSGDLLRQLERLRLPASCKFLTADIKEFFMSGQHRELIDFSAAVIEQEAEQIMYRKLATFIVENQVVTLRNQEDIAYKVKRGSGMGVACSGEISDLCFHGLCEKDFATVPEEQSRAGVLFYARFKDDILMIVDGDFSRWSEFWRTLKRKARFFEVEVTKISKDSVVFLDVELWKGPRFHHTGYLDHRPYSKETSIWTPLSTNSCHPPAVHDAWPKAMERRFELLSSSRREREVACELFRARLRRESTETFCRSTRTSCYTRLILPYRTLWRESRLGNALYRIGTCYSEDWSRLSLSWRLGDRRLAHRVRSLNWMAHEDADAYNVWR